MKIEELGRECIACGACVSICPKKCIEWKEKRIEKYPVINSECIQCMLCERVCPILTQAGKNATNIEAGYCGWSNSEDLRKSSSSGGIFGEIALTVLKDGGVVVGAVFDRKTKKVRHMTSDYVELNEILKSKYVESDAEKSFPEIKKNLTSGRKVLFCGTPCQVSALSNYLYNINTEKLLLCDFICHGVGVDKIFTVYLEELEKKFRSKIVSVDFRPKTLGWSQHAIKVNFENGRCYFKPAILDEYFSGVMIDNVLLRSGCYTCQFTQKHVADITMADFWGINNYNRNLNDNKGISLFIGNSEKGIRKISELRDKITKYPLEKRHFEYVYSEKEWDEKQIQKREDVLKKIQKYGLVKAAHKTYFKNRCVFKIKYIVKNILKKGN